MMFKPETITVTPGNGLEIFVRNSPDDSLWRIQSVHLVPKIVGAVDLSRLQNSSGDRARADFVGLTLLDGHVEPPPELVDRTFASADEAKAVITQVAADGWRSPV